MSCLPACRGRYIRARRYGARCFESKRGIVSGIWSGSHSHGHRTRRTCRALTVLNVGGGRGHDVYLLQLSVLWFRSVLPCGALAVGDAAASYPSNPAIPKNIPISTYDIIFVNGFVAMHIDIYKREGGRLNDPYRISLRLLPLGPGRIGE